MDRRRTDRIDGGLKCHSLFITTIRADIDSLYLSRDSGGTLFVDQAFPGASDDNDGLSATSPKKTITGAIGSGNSGWKIRVAPGNYTENIVIPAGYEGLMVKAEIVLVQTEQLFPQHRVFQSRSIQTTSRSLIWK